MLRRGFGSVLACALLLAGCATDGKLKARGKVVKGGAPFTVAEDDFVKVIFMPVHPGGKPADNTYIAQYDNTTGNFTVIGPDLHGLPPGKYRVSVAHERKRKDLLKNAYDFER